MTTLPIFITIIVILFLFIFVVVGWCNGFLRIIFATFSMMIVLLITYLLTPAVTNLLTNHTFVGPKVETAIGSYIEGQYEKKKTEIEESLIAQAGGYAIDVDEYLNNAEGSIASYGLENDFISALALPSFLKNKLIENNTAEKYAQLGVSTFSQYVTAQLSSIVMKGISFILLFVILSLAVNIVYAAARLISKIPILKGFNRLLGAITGLIEGLLILWCICIFIMVLSGTAFGTSCMSIIQGSKVLSFIYNNNLPVMLFKSVFTIL